MIPDIAIGAIAATIIGTVVSLVGLIVSKEGKVSEFRQDWINSLRKEFATYLTHVSSYTDASAVRFESDRDKFNVIQPLTDKLNESYYMIAFRLNPTEDTSKKIKSCMVNISSMIRNPSEIDPEFLEAAKIDFITNVNELLKNEWKIVKIGEPVYRGTRMSAFASLLILTLLVSLWTWQNWPKPTRDLEVDTDVTNTSPNTTTTVTADPSALP